MLRPRKYVNFFTPADVGEPRVLQHPFPLCIQQSTGYSVTPEVYVRFRVVRDLFVDDDIADLDSPAGLEHAV